MSDSGFHVLPVRIYYEDTDAGGVVYYANYLKFAERARTEMIRALGIEQERLRQQQDIMFVVRSCSVEFMRPARLDDLLHVETRVCRISGARVDMEQAIRRVSDPSGLTDDALLVTLSVRLACLNGSGRPVRLPTRVHGAFVGSMDSSVSAFP
ncbi:tol-pal system-associated acyl-CoA thioesterase [Haematospirillum jordaniae]|uniref:Acyl-CoA thioester hydrolase n=1 Tax=Haematospirillum jordaniae TaxID=1549855 RepID=A0A143DE61_9PROT|nr:tol-pal system-associated acyl-CoA thioesterase [Haematospirillum jordaniae]AMW35042.1 acyl-CoA thioester hydrolase [Haematospirillum jordaniae]NKD44217.1 tol-pal system-associated acyl-CoA thioesterase [Haematospirillum jordaniae]NKD56595.1 tol-pal system-associated acyl-CoA thioesterase [Haematospirillum jordaniae]NKD58653.1 tol-pal system-associated acyl-CoA thioesterase [Haematospirillum jordaniae]NKD66178.1 tol-pal system-associated acyl-CoA thioesterase [Haematospirillum jordaniae]